MDQLSGQHLTKKQTVQKYPFLTENLLKNWAFKDIDGFRHRVLRKVGRRLFLNEEELLKFLNEHRG